MNRQPRFVPLPEVSEHTDRISVGNLGLPVGFDTDQLELNVRGLNRTMQWAGINHVTLQGGRGDTTEPIIGVGGVDSSGTATAAGSGAVARAKLQNTDINRPLSALPEAYQWGEATIGINNAEIERHIINDGDRWDRGLIDPRARAHYMDRAVRGAAVETAHEAIAPDPKSFSTEYLLMSAVNAAFGYYLFKESVPEALIASQVSFIAPYVIDDLARKMLHQELPPRQWSVTPKPVDRLIAANVVARATTFIRPTPTIE